MKLLRNLMAWEWTTVSTLALAAMLVTSGCETTPETNRDGDEIAAMSGEGDRFAVGEQVRVSFSGIPDPILPHEERVKGDGTITLPLIGSVKALGKSPGELQKELQGLYVPKYYVRLIVTVTSQERVFYVGGQVRQPGRQIYIGETTITKAIQSSGDFTDFADKKRVKLIRPGQKPVIVNCVEALENPSKDLPVFPGDKIYVPQRWW